MRLSSKEDFLIEYLSGNFQYKLTFDENKLENIKHYLKTNNIINYNYNTSFWFYSKAETALVKLVFK